MYAGNLTVILSAKTTQTKTLSKHMTQMKPLTLMKHMIQKLRYTQIPSLALYQLLSNQHENCSTETVLITSYVQSSFFQPNSELTLLLRLHR